jgi:hypothetical protein
VGYVYSITPKEILMPLLYYLHVVTILIEIFVKKPFFFFLVTLIDFTFGAGEKHPATDSWKIILIVCRDRIAQSGYLLATGWTTKGSEFESRCVPGALSPGVKRPGREADHSPPSSA